MSVVLTWIGQGGFIIEAEGSTICIDPYLTNSLYIERKKFDRLFPPPLRPEELKADLIIVTHDHIDHFDQATLERVDQERSLFAGPASCRTHMNDMGIPSGRILGLDRNGTVALPGITIYGVHAEHTEDSIGIVVKMQKHTLYFVGDSLFDDRLLDVKQLNPDVLITCINGKLGNMDYSDAAKLADAIGVTTAIPCHYGMFRENTEDPENFKKQLKDHITYMELEFNKPYRI